MAERDRTVTISVVQGQAGNHCVVVNDTRVAGGKPWAGGQIIGEWTVPAKRIFDAVADTTETE